MLTVACVEDACVEDACVEVVFVKFACEQIGCVKTGFFFLNVLQLSDRHSPVEGSQIA